MDNRWPVNALHLWNRPFLFSHRPFGYYIRTMPNSNSTVRSKIVAISHSFLLIKFKNR